MIFNRVESINNDAFFYAISRSIFGVPFYLKLEHMNIAGSIKLKTAIYLMKSLEDQSLLIHGKSKIIESSSGNLGVALSLVCKIKEYQFTCVIDPNTNPHNTTLMQLYGANVICVNERDKNGGFLGTRLKLIDSMLKQDHTLLWTNQYANNYNIKAHYETTAQEIYNELDHIDFLFVGAGTTGTLMGCASFIRQYKPRTKLIAVDIEGSMTFKNSAKKRSIPGLGTSKRPSIVDESLIDDIVIVSEQETVRTCNELLDKTGLLLGGSTGSVIAGIKQYRSKILAEQVVVAISPDAGERYIDTVYNPLWVKERIGYI